MLSGYSSKMGGKLILTLSLLQMPYSLNRQIILFNTLCNEKILERSKISSD